jgi:hypothetical protein
MAVSTTSFADRLGRIEKSTPQLFAGDDAPQSFRPDKLVCTTKKRGLVFYIVIAMGALIGAAVGYGFRTEVGFDIFLTQPPLLIWAIVKSQSLMLLFTLGMAAGPVMALACNIFSFTQARALQFWSGYLAGSIVVNGHALYYVYLTYFAAP